MRRRDFTTLVGGAVLMWPLAARAATAERVAHIGVLMPFAEGDPEDGARRAAFEGRLAQLGWTRGRNIRIDYRWRIDNAERAQAAIAELLALAPDVLLADTSQTVAAIQRATRTVPVVFTMIYEPVRQSFVQSLAHPGGNITGFTMPEATIGAKWLDLLKEMAPALMRVAYMCNPRNPGPMQAYPAFETAARNQGVASSLAAVHEVAEIEAEIEALAREPGGGLIVPPDGFLAQQGNLIIELAARNRLPAVYGFPRLSREGGLLSYGIDPSEQFRQAAEYVDRILRGEKPGDLPVQTPTKFATIINLKTAKALGLTVSSDLLARADELIE